MKGHSCSTVCGDHYYHYYLYYLYYLHVGRVRRPGRGDERGEQCPPGWSHGIHGLQRPAAARGAGGSEQGFVRWVGEGVMGV